MKKILVLIGVVFFLSGCSVKYEIDLTNSGVNESLNIVETDPSNQYFETLKDYNDDVPVIYTDQDPDMYGSYEGVEFYDINNLSSNKKADFTLSHKFASNEFNKSNIINTCYNQVTFINNKETLNINTSSNFLCFTKYVTLDNVEISIKTNKEITSHNADKVENNTYTWVINKENAMNKSIQISAEKNKQVSKKSENNSLNLNIILIIIGAFIGLIIGLFIYKNHKYNSN